MSENSVQERFDAQQVVAMAMRLSVNEIEALGESTELREEGLKTIRAGDLQLGQQLIAEARENQQRVRLSAEAQTLFDTYQLAAESYVHYVVGNLEKAEAAMMMSISTANALQRSYGYIIELRRVHLAANIIRINLKHSDPSAAIAMGIKLIKYLGGDTAQWPWDELALDQADHLTSEEQILILSQLLSPLASALSKLPAHKLSDIGKSLGALAREATDTSPASQMINEWINKWTSHNTDKMAVIALAS